MSVNYNGGGSTQYDVQIQSAAGAAPIAAVADGFFTAVLPVAGVWTAVAIANQPDVPRNVTFGIVDADSGIASAYLEVIGTDSQDRALEETLTFSGGGTATIVGNKCFKTITSARFIAAATVSGADTLQGGYGNILGLPYDIGAVSDVINRREDGNAGVGTIDATYNSWTLSGGNVPDAANRYYVTIRSTA